MSDKFKIISCNKGAFEYKDFILYYIIFWGNYLIF